MKLGIEGLLGLLIPNVITEFQNSKWKIQYGDYNIQILPEFNETRCLGKFVVADSEFDKIQNSGRNMATIIQYSNSYTECPILTCAF